MPRPSGVKNREFDQKRDALLEQVERRLSEPDGHRAGIRALASAAGVTYPTLKHYFGDRDAIVTALLAKRAEGAKRYLEQMASTKLPFQESVFEAAMFLVGAAGADRFRALHEIGLREGLRQPVVAQTYLVSILEPTIAAIESRLSLHISNGEMRKSSTRIAALSLISPIYVSMLHQHGLAGRDLRPLDFMQLARELAANFVRAYAAA